MGELTLSEMERLVALQDADRTFQMDEDAFRAFYDTTARPLWSYLARITGDRRQADDLLQETYYRFLRSAPPCETDEHRRRYLFRIATNLARDHRRRRVPHAHTTAISADTLAAPGETRLVDAAATQLDARIDVTRAMARLKPRERALLSLAYIHGWSHAEIAESLGLRAASLKALLWRARRRLLQIIKAEPGPDPGGTR